MIGFSVAMWFVSVFLIGTSVSLLRGNISMLHGKATEDKVGYAKAMGKPNLLVGISTLASGIAALIGAEEAAILRALLILAAGYIPAFLWFWSIQKKYSA